MKIILLHNKNIKIALLVLLFVLTVASITQGSLNAITYSQDSMWPRVKAILSGINPYNRNLMIEFYEIYGYENHFLYWSSLFPFGLVCHVSFGFN